MFRFSVDVTMVWTMSRVKTRSQQNRQKDTFRGSGTTSPVLLRLEPVGCRSPLSSGSPDSSASNRPPPCLRLPHLLNRFLPRFFPPFLRHIFLFGVFTCAVLLHEGLDKLLAETVRDAHPPRTHCDTARKHHRRRTWPRPKAELSSL